MDNCDHQNTNIFSLNKNISKMSRVKVYNAKYKTGMNKDFPKYVLYNTRRVVILQNLHCTETHYP